MLNLPYTVSMLFSSSSRCAFLPSASPTRTGSVTTTACGTRSLSAWLLPCCMGLLQVQVPLPEWGPDAYERCPPADLPTGAW